MTLVTVPEAKARLFRLIKEVSRGGEVVIVDGNKGIVKLVPYSETKHLRKPGYLKGKIKISADFDAPLPEG